MANDGRSYEHQHFDGLNDSLDASHQGGARATAIGIFGARNGLPIGGALSPARLLQLMHETRNAA